MEDGPESAEGKYEYNGLTYSLEERRSEVWSVRTPDGSYLGDVVAVEVVDESGPHYTVRFADDREAEHEFVDEWQRALEYLIEQSLA